MSDYGLQIRESLRDVLCIDDLSACCILQRRDFFFFSFISDTFGLFGVMWLGLMMVTKRKEKGNGMRMGHDMAPYVCFNDLVLAFTEENVSLAFGQCVS